jgi:hypothetical protein
MHLGTAMGLQANLEGSVTDAITSEARRVFVGRPDAPCEPLFPASVGGQAARAIRACAAETRLPPIVLRELALMRHWVDDDTFPKEMFERAPRNARARGLVYVAFSWRSHQVHRGTSR